MFGLVRLALRQLKCVQYYVVPNDKQPGSTFVRMSDLQAMECAVLPAPLYALVYLHHIDVGVLTAQYSSIAKDVGLASDDKELACQISSTWIEGRLCSSLATTYKTHKAAGDVIFRAIHQGIAPSFEGLARWLVSVLETILRQYCYIMRDCHQFVEVVTKVHVATHAKMACVDLKDFYLSGSPQTLRLRLQVCSVATLLEVCKTQLFLYLAINL